MPSGRQLRHDEPPGDGADAARAVRRARGSGRSRDYPQRLLAALRAAAPAGVDDPTVVVLTPGVYNSAYFEHALLARLDGRRAGRGPRPGLPRRPGVDAHHARAASRCDVIYRRVDDEFLDPVQFRADSVLGVPGLINAARAGQRHDRQRGRQRRRRRQARLHLRARPDPLLPRRGADPPATSTPGGSRSRRRSRRCSTGSTSWWSSRSTAPAARASSSGRQRRRAELDELRATAARRPARLDRAAGRPALDGPDPRRRTAARRGTSTCGRSRSTTATGVWVLPGGLTRVALPEGELVVNSSPGRRLEGHLGARPADRPTPSGRRRRPAASRPQAAGPRSLAPDRRPRAGHAAASQQQQQQQQQAAGRWRRAEPDRRVAVLDRPLRRARRRTPRASSTCTSAAARGPVDRRGRRLPVAAVGHGRRRRAPRRAASTAATCSTCSRSTATTPASIADALARGPGERPPGPRDVSTEMWEALNTTYRAIPTRPVPAQRPPGDLPWVRERAALVIGIADSTMSRDEGWQFLILGRCIERADMTARLLATRGAGRRHRGRRGPRRCAPAAPTRRSCAPTAACETERGAAEFLLLDRLFPRSVVFALNRAEQCLDDARAAGQPAGVPERGAAAARPDPHRAGVPPARDMLADLPQRDGARAAHLRARPPRRSRRRYFAGAEAADLERGAGRSEHAAADRAHAPASSTTARRSRRTTRPG